MTSRGALWIEGARIRTLPAALAPVVIGAACAAHLNAFDWSLSVMALQVALFLQIGVNYSNDYSDGIRGTDEHRIGPPRLTASGQVAPTTVLVVSLVFYALAGISGIAVVALSNTWWLLGAGVAAILAAWFYTGGKNPYGYMGVGLSEILVFVFFGLMATVGTTYVQTSTTPWWVWLLASGIGCISVSLLIVNNTRDIATDSVAGKKTLCVRLGDTVSRRIYNVLLGVAVLFYVVVVAFIDVQGVPAIIFGVVLALFGATLGHRMLGAHSRIDFLGLLRDTGLYAVIYASVIAVLFIMG